jgi:hypothetical protein
MSEPLFILGPPRSFTSVVSAMLGQHPEMYGLPEIHLFVTDTVAELNRFYEIAGNRRQHGILRTIAELFMSKQDPITVEMAKRWLKKNPQATTAEVWKKIVDRVHPKIVVEKSVTTVWRPDFLARAASVFPNARYLHLTRHPRAQGESMAEALKTEKQISRHMLDHGTQPPTVDPQILWYSIHNNIVTFLENIPEERKLHVRGEDLLVEPDVYLCKICEWLGIRADAEALEEMKHPENSPFSKIGPKNAPFGNDPKFLESPALRPTRAKAVQSLEGPLKWREDAKGFSPEVKVLAQAFGYQ